MKNAFILVILILAVACLSAQTMIAPYSENFDNMTAGTGVAPQNGWSRLVYHPTGFANATVNIATTTPRSAPNVARLFTDSTPGAQIMLISPEAINLASSRIIFWSRISGTSATALPDMQVGFMTDPTDHNSFMPVQRITNLNLSYQQYEVSFQGHDYDEEERYFIAFKHGISGANRAILIDDFSYEVNPLQPLFSVSPVSKNFGTVDVGLQSSAQVFTITNAGIGQLAIQSITLTGNDLEHFTITDQPLQYPVLLSNIQSITVTVVFNPTSIGDKSAYLSVLDNQGERILHSIPLSGRGFIPPQGANHNNPILITLPEFSFADLFDDYLNDYGQNWVTPSQHYLIGNDVVFSLDLQEDSYVSSGVVVNFSHIAVTIVDRAPDPSNPAPVYVTAGGPDSASFSRFPLQAGNYFVIVSSYLNSPPNSGQSFSFSFLTEPAGSPVLQITPASFSFAYVPIGYSSSKVFSLKNPGGGTVHINSIQFQSSTSEISYFEPAVTYPFVLNVGQHIDFTVDFVPISAGFKQAQVIINYQLDDSPVIEQESVNLDGMGYFEFAGGSGTVTDPYLIAAPYHLNSIRYHLGEASRNKHFLQTEHLDFDVYPYNTGSGWDPIGYHNTDTDYLAFTGSYNGNGLEIKDLYSNHPSRNHIGLFGVIEGASIKNVNIREADINGQVRVGALVGYSLPNLSIMATIANCSVVSGTVKGIAFIGGMVGWNGRGHITKCYSDLHVQISSNQTNYDPQGKMGYGGLVGCNLTQGLVEFCYSTSTVDGYGGVGGLIGYQSQGTVKNSYARGNVSGLGGRIGGLVGGNIFLAITERCYSTGMVTALPGQPAGGLLGSLENLSDCTVSFWDVETSGISTSAGSEEGRTTMQMTFPYDNPQSTYLGWNFSVNWQHDQLGEVNDRYPYLRWQDPITQPPVPPTPVLAINRIGDQILLSWQAIQGAGFYNIYAADSPVTDDWGIPIGSTMGTSFIILMDQNNRFFRVKAATITP